ncbi:hypothetical protein [Novosphingopyxis sp.]|uniref:hypothetical protein n=1 Tax=Novosphingopyxis sp. TaxID=2709690 RepID=UPI003B592A74
MTSPKVKLDTIAIRTANTSMPGGCVESAEVSRIQDMIQDTHKIEGHYDRLITDLDAVFDDYDISPEAREILRDGNPPQVHAALGIHAVLCMQWSTFVNEKIREHVVADSAFLKEMEAF